MATSKVPNEVIVMVAREQGGIPAHLATCANPTCSRKATDPHHWLFKRSSGVSRTSLTPEQVLHHPYNIVLLCRLCHDTLGQTEEMIVMCFRYKVNLGIDILDWVDELLKQGLIRVRPDLHGVTYGKT